MSIYITVYVIFSIILLIFLNFLFTRKRKQTERYSTITQTTVEKNEEENLEEQVEDLLKESAIAEPALEYVEANVTPLKEEKSETLSRVKDAKMEPSKGKILAALMLGAFVAILNQTLLNVAIPHIMTDLGVSATTVQWLSTGYMLVNGIFIPVTAFLIEKFGTRKLFITSVLLFTVGSIICSLSANFSM
jgi:Na+/melibiose symporter-like transporter